MKFIKLLGSIIRYNPVKCILLVVMIVSGIISLNIDPNEKVKVNHYIRLSKESVYIQYDKTEELIKNKSIYYKDGYAHYPDFAIPCTMLLVSIVLLIIFCVLAFSDDDDYNFDISGCRALSRMGDVTITSVGNGEYVYLLDRKAIAITPYSTMKQDTLRYYINNYIRHPNMYFIYTTRDDIRLDTLNDIINLEL